MKKQAALELTQSTNRLEAAINLTFYRGFSLADIAHVIMLLENEIIPQASGKKLLTTLLEMRTIPPDEFPFDPTLDAYTNREQFIIKLLPDEGGWLRTGRARRDATNVAYQLTVRLRLLALLNNLIDLMETLLDQVNANVDTLMPDYTYLQQAQPTTFGHYLLGFVYPMLRDAERLRACYGRVNLCPGGIGSTNGSRLSLDRESLAELLGFDAPIHHTRDAMWQADMIIEIMAVAVALMVNLDRLAEDLQVFATQEFGLIELDDAYCRTSVIMPQKKNPYSLTYIRGLTNVMIGRSTAMANVGRTPTGQPDNRIFAYDEVPLSLRQITETVCLMTGVIRTLKANAETMLEGIDPDSQATDLAEIIMQRMKMPYHQAHQIVGEGLANIIGQDFMSANQLDDLLNPRAIVDTRIGIGGAAHEPMQAMINECNEKMVEIQAWRDQVGERLITTEADLIKLAESLC
jgi:argininosuccinate lyase